MEVAGATVARKRAAAATTAAVPIPTSPIRPGRIRLVRIGSSMAKKETVATANVVRSLAPSNQIPDRPVWA